MRQALLALACVLAACETKPTGPRLKLDGGVAPPEADAVAKVMDAAPAVAPPHATAVVVGAQASCAVLSDGGVRCWGANADGELGDGTGKDACISAPVTFYVQRPSLNSPQAPARGR